MWQTRCDMFKVTHRHDFVCQKVYRQPSFSVWTRAWTRLVVDTLRGKMTGRAQHRKLCDKLYADTCFYENIFMRTHPCKSTSCVEGRLFTVNTHHSSSRGSNHCSQTWHCMWKIAYWDRFASKVMLLYIVLTCLWKIWWPTWCHMFNVTHRNDFVTQKVSRHPSFSVWTRAWTRVVVETLRGNMSVELNIKNYGSSCIQTRPLMRKFACGHVHVSQKVA